jgi:hypothetical protein
MVPCKKNDGRTERSNIILRKDNVANIRAVQDLFIWDGELSDESVDVGHLSLSYVNLELHNLGNANVNGYIRIVDGELVDEILDTASISQTSVSISVANLGNARSWELYIEEGELVDEIVDIELDLDSSTVHIVCDNMGNAETAYMTQIVEGELLDEVVDVSGVIRNSDAMVELTRSANSRGAETTHEGVLGHHQLSIDSGDLMDEVIDTLHVEASSNIHVHLSDSGNAYTTADNVILLHSELISQPVIDESFGHCGMPAFDEWRIVDERGIGRLDHQMWAACLVEQVSSGIVAPALPTRCLYPNLENCVSDCSTVSQDLYAQCIGTCVSLC